MLGKTRNRSQHFPRVQDSLWVECLLHSAHQLQLDRRLVALHLGAFHLPDTVLGAETAAQLGDQIIDDSVGARGLFDECRARYADWRGQVVVQISVAQMAEDDIAYAGQGGVEGLLGARQERRYP